MEGTTFREVGHFDEIRAYALGEQNNNKYRDILDPCEKDGKGYMNINWDNVKILPKFRDIVRGKMLLMDFEPNVKAIDEKSTKERLMRKNKMMMLTDPRIQQMIAMTGAMPDVELPPGVETIEDINIIDDLGGLKLFQEIAMENAIEVSNHESGYKTLRKMWIDDIIDLNMAASKVYCEAKTGKIKYRYCDPANLIIMDSIYPDYRDAMFAGEIRRMTLSEIRLETDLDENQVKMIAQKYRSHKTRGFDTANMPNDFLMKQPSNNQTFAQNIVGFTDGAAVDVLDFLLHS